MRIDDQRQHHPPRRCIVTSPRKPRALVYGDVNLNILDGSAIWVQSICEALSRAGVEVRVLLKAPITTERLVAPLRAMPGVEVIDPFASGRVTDAHPLGVPDAVRILSDLDAGRSADLIVVRGLRLVAGAARNERLAGRLWTYLTDVPQHVFELRDANIDVLADIAAASRFMLCQTEELRCFLEAVVPGAPGKCIPWPPIVPDVDSTAGASRPTTEHRLGSPERPISLVYTGKYAAAWNTLEMTELPSALAQLGLSAELHMVGDKIHDEPGIPGWSQRMTEALTKSPGVIWHGGVPRQDAMNIAAAADLGLSWRAESMNASLELSTKVLEFSRLGVPVLLNRTPMHEELLGDDYPFFVATRDDIVAALAGPGLEQSLDEARHRLLERTEQFTMAAAVQRLRAALARAIPEAPTSVAERRSTRPLRVGVASHDLKFFTRILEHLRALPQIEVRLDEWESLSGHDESVSRELVEWADVIICEWAGPNAVWYSRHKRPDQRLIVRLHRFELEAGWLADIDIDAVDQVICVSPHYARLTAQQTGWPADRIVVVPNWVDIEQFDRPKLPGAQFTLGMIGISPHRKRPDLGVEVLSRVRRYDARFRLAVKSKMPWDYWWIWRKPEEREATITLMDRLRDDPTVRGAVSFDGFGGDVPAWLRRVGWVLSTSDDESFHLAPAEGMASRAVPAILPWPGADTIYSPRWIHADPCAIAESVLDTVHRGDWTDLAEDAFAEVATSFPLTDVCDTWSMLLVEDVPADTADVALYETKTAR
jgi:glycosyltransferase involved in cell wall biosynthesis